MPPTVIRLLDGKDKVQDSISGEYEDSFCLESFEDLCKAHFASEPQNTKSFIIARVQTVDPKQPDKEFYSFYNAFHLNKTLFQTQIYLKKRYIHRLHVLNPLTNSDIIGNVQYYMVNSPKVEETVKVAVADVGISPKASQRKIYIVYTQPETPHDVSIDVPSSSKDKDMVINMHQVHLEEKCDARQTPDIIKKLSFMKRPSLTGSKVTVARRNTLTSYPVETFALSTEKPRRYRKSDASQLHIHSMTPSGSLAVGEAETKLTRLGTVTRFAVPITKEEIDQFIPKTQRGNRRSLSYRNAVSASGVPATFLEWTKMVGEEYIDSATNAEPSILPEQTVDEDVNYDVVVFGRSSRASRSSKINNPMSPGSKTPNLNTIKDEDEDDEAEKTTNIEHAKSADSSSEQKDSKVTAKVVLEELEDQEDVEGDDDEEVTIKVFDAIFFATDSDFLENSKTRQIFRNNAIKPEDAKLFEMKEFTGAETTPQDFEIIRDTFPCEFCYPSEREMARMSSCTRFLHTHKCIIVASLITLLIIVFILVMIFQNLGKSS